MNVALRALAPGETDHERLWTLVGLTSLLGGALTFRFGDVTFFPCPIKTLTGLPCLTCGATRAVLALLSGHIWNALRLNPLMVAGAAAAAVYLVYAAAVSGLGLCRVRIALSSDDRAWLRRAVCTVAAGAWLFLILDGR